MIARAATFVLRVPWLLLLFVAALFIPWLGSRYDTFLATQIAIDALFAVSLNMLLGTAGLVSFGHVAYFGIGAYICGILMKTYAVPFSAALPAAITLLGDRGWQVRRKAPRWDHPVRVPALAHEIDAA